MEYNMVLQSYLILVRENYRTTAVSCDWNNILMVYSESTRYNFSVMLQQKKYVGPLLSLYRKVIIMEKKIVVQALEPTMAHSISGQKGEKMKEKIKVFFFLGMPFLMIQRQNKFYQTVLECILIQIPRLVFFPLSLNGSVKNALLQMRTYISGLLFIVSVQSTLSFQNGFGGSCFDHIDWFIHSLHTYPMFS